MRRTLRDHLGREVKIPRTVKRIVCLCPSLTETLFALGAGDCIVGRTQYCTRPVREVDPIAGVGGTKTVNVERVIDLAPDVIIASKEENEKEQVEALAERCAVYVVDVNSYREALRAVTDLGEILRRPDEAVSLVKRIEDGFARLRPLAPPVRTAYLIWRDPYRAAGKGTCIHSIMQRCGLENVCAILDGRYPELTSRLLPGLSPQLVLLGSEPYPFDEIHIDEIRTLLPEADVLLADGEMFTWYGARMVEAAEYLAGLVEQIRQRVGES